MPYNFAANVKGMMEITRTIVSNGKGESSMNFHPLSFFFSIITGSAYIP